MARKFRSQAELDRFLKDQKRLTENDWKSEIGLDSGGSRPAVGVDQKPDFRDLNTFRSLAGAQGIYLR